MFAKLFFPGIKKVEKRLMEGKGARLDTRYEIKKLKLWSQKGLK
jgi:hypothetical protein